MWPQDLAIVVFIDDGSLKSFCLSIYIFYWTPTHRHTCHAVWAFTRLSDRKLLITPFLRMTATLLKAFSILVALSTSVFADPDCEVITILYSCFVFGPDIFLLDVFSIFQADQFQCKDGLCISLEKR